MSIYSKITSILPKAEKPIKSISSDNDLAFTNHYLLNAKEYFTNPYGLQEKEAWKIELAI